MADQQGNGASVSAPVRVVVDAMGGDFAPQAIVQGAVRALDRGNVAILLVGDQGPVEAELARYSVVGKPIKVVPSVGKIGDDEHPVQAMRQKRQASIVVATQVLKSGQADALVSLGSTGASMASATMLLGLMEGLERPCIGGPFLGLAPRTVLVDLGSNVDCRPSLLLSFAALGSAFARQFLDIQNPRVGLLSVGSEDAKGNRQVQESLRLFRESHLNFVGNVEGNDFFTDRADVVVCDGFVGNILLKYTEGLGSALMPYLQKQLAYVLPAQVVQRIGAELWQMTNLPRTMGGPLFGVNGTVVVGHGSSKAEGVAGAIGTAVRCVQIGLVEGMRQELAALPKGAEADPPPRPQGG